ncbi:hypothetical protein BWP39_13020 [Paraburkholderia acidicola]|uniref:Uncharacterized protein n=1 Tax=Paraburkholderia acidicola TaxID=1912599 RepID=A0A2A4EV04_9BURK|nr:hypothetical protein BWP39_13020 [Paraburkholderia acidicola]
MFTDVFKRNIWPLLSAALVTFTIQYHETGRVSAWGIAIFLFTYVVMAMALERLNVRWRQRFGARRRSRVAQAVLWLVTAICLYLLFRHFDRT